MLLALHTLTAVGTLEQCGGEFSLCPDGSCALTQSGCGRCPAGQYACPLSKQCVASAADWQSCPSLKGTYLDWTLTGSMVCRS